MFTIQNHKHNEPCCERLVEDHPVQSGFRKGPLNIFNLRTICERHIELQKNIYACFIDYEKTFDRVNREKMLECVENIKIDGRDLRSHRNLDLYWRHTAVVGTKNGFSSGVQIKRGVRQGCIISPRIFNICSEMKLRDILDYKGLEVSGQNIIIIYAMQMILCYWLAAKENYRK